MKLYEEILFGANELQTIRKIYKQSTVDNIKYDSDAERKLVVKVIRSINRGLVNVNEKEFDRPRVIYLCLYAASYGPDTKQNQMLRYLVELCKNSMILLEQRINNVNYVLNLIQHKTIEISDEVDTYLLNQSTYNRNTQDFDYTVKAFDAVIHKKSKYFNSDPAIVPATDKNVIASFFRDDANYDYDALNNLAAVPINQKYFFEGGLISLTDKIIPAGRNGQDNSARTIWNYMEIWSNDTDADQLNNAKSQQSKNNRMKNRVNQVKNFIRNKNDAWTDDDKAGLISFIDEIM